MISCSRLQLGLQIQQLVHHLYDLALLIRDDFEHQAGEIGHACLVHLVASQECVPETLKGEQR